MRPLRIALAVAATLAAFGLVLDLSRATHASVPRPFIIGFQNAPPYHFSDVSGNPAGPDVDVLNTAAARLGIRLNWRFSPEGPEKAFTSGVLDLWPLMGDLPQRPATF